MISKKTKDNSTQHSIIPKIVEISKKSISSSKMSERGKRSRIRAKRKKTDEQKDRERWKVDVESAISMQLVERTRLEKVERQQEEARKYARKWTEPELRRMQPKKI